MKNIFNSIWKIKLHNKILLGLILGALFGAYFNVNKYEIKIHYRDNNRPEVATVKSWQSVEVFIGDERKEKFGPEDQLKLINYFNSLSTKENEKIIVKIVIDSTKSIERVFQNIKSIEKVKTIPLYLKPIGTIFIRLLMFIAVPLVLASLIVGAASLGNIKTVGKIGGKMILLYAFLITCAITIGLTLANTIKPGEKLTPESREKLLTEYAPNLQTKLRENIELDVVSTVVNIVPTNPISSLANSEMLQIVFFALFVGITLTMISKEKSEPVIKFFDGFSTLMIRMVDIIMKMAPLGVFVLISATVSEFGFEILQTLFWYALTLIIGLSIQQFIVLGSIVKILGKISPIKFFKAIRDVMLISFSSSSSAATLPVNMECCEQNLGIPKKITSFVLPLGATINMDGTSMYQAVAAVFIAQVYGIDLHISEQLVILLTALLASIGTAPVPGVGIIMLIIVLRSVNIPEEGIALILGIDRILDMCRTVVNTSGDAVVATVIARQEGYLNNSKILV